MVTRPTSRRAFTLIELVVVTIVLGIVMFIAVPRFVGGNAREMDNAAHAVVDMLTMFSHRESTSDRPVAIEYDKSLHQFRLLIVEGDLQQKIASTWIRDPHTRPVRLPNHVEIDEARIDGVPIADADDQWRIETEPGQTRPRIDIVLKSGGKQAHISLLPYGVSAHRADDKSYDEDTRRPIDLDAIGRGREQW